LQRQKTIFVAFDFQQDINVAGSNNGDWSWAISGSHEQSGSKNP
jgi:hypothetical protein